MRNELTIRINDRNKNNATVSLTLGDWIMHTRSGRWTLNIMILAACIALIAWAAPDIRRHCGWGSDEDVNSGVRTSYIIQGEDVLGVSSLVHHAGGKITHTLPIINAVGANLTAGQVSALQKSKTIVRIYKNRSASVMGTSETQDGWGSEQVPVAGRKTTGKSPTPAAGESPSAISPSTGPRATET